MNKNNNKYKYIKDNKSSKKSGPKSEISTTTKVMSFGLLIILCVSVIAYAFISGDSSTNVNQNQDVPFGKIFKNSQTEELYYGTIKNKEQFIFVNMTGYEDNRNLSQIADRIKENTRLEIFVDSSYNSSESVFLIEKALRALEIDYTKVYVESNLNTDIESLILTKNNTKNYPNSIVYEDENYLVTENLVYHLVK